MLMLPQSLYSQRTKSSLSAGEQRKAQKSLKNAKYFLKFLNISVSNSGTEEEKKLFKEAVRRDLISRIVYMKFCFHEAFVETKKSHRLIIEIFKKIINRENSESYKMLHSFATEVLASKDPLAKKYLSLGYREVKLSKMKKIMADNLQEKNYSIRIGEYIISLKRAKYARRYAILALLQSRLEPEKRLKVDFSSYKKIKRLIELYGGQEKERMLKIHQDNYYILKGESLFESVMIKPELNKIPEYEKHLRKL